MRQAHKQNKANKKQNGTNKKKHKEDIITENKEPKDYEIFLDIKQSYEGSLARMDALVKTLKAENRKEKLGRMKFQKIAEDTRDRESIIINNLTSKFEKQLAETTEANRVRIEKDYAYALKVQKQTVLGQRETLVSQNMAIKKLCKFIMSSENTIMNQRFTLYKMTMKDTFGAKLLPPKGSGFELLNRNLHHHNVEQIGFNILKQAKRLNVDVY